MKFSETILLILLLGALAFSGYLLYQNLPREPVALVPSSQINNNFPVGSFNSSIQFYPRMRFKQSMITYGFESACTSEKEDQVVRAFNNLEDKTILEFETSSDPEIDITCSDLAPEPQTKGHFVAGEGEPTEIINNTLYAVILKGKISLYRNEKCEEPNIATHEILHVLGFDHNGNPKSILYPTLNCEQTIDQYLIDEINDLYKPKSAPDLIIEKVSASLAGRYLSFEIEILNQGLQDAPNILLGVYGDDDFEEVFVIGNIPIGTKKMLTVQNVKATNSLSEATFFVDPKNQNDEIYEDNNKKSLIIEG